jgi:hypothetical protein
LDRPVEPEDLEQIKFEDIIVDTNLEVLDEKSMGEALTQYIHKNEVRAIATMVEKMLNLRQKTLTKQARAGGENGDSGTTMDNTTAVREVAADDDSDDASPPFVSTQLYGGYDDDDGYAHLDLDEALRKRREKHQRERAAEQERRRMEMRRRHNQEVEENDDDNGEQRKRSMTSVRADYDVERDEAA